ncbi:helix-turn-helix domain-containing protein [Natranaerobius thermophilus]|uniref:DNA binding domain protein, excisionase family n=1 Tax=Natranaerobius thermophilus (strain ATCC BAA-1301 / DSM 18059 / JW/NM-WN-LF) TaxID=457570 RepID=B2A8Q0_NATTJ|nr:helix-turn-helix domain-containing protein [Natranaerobius thermophilus]ACB86499.1 DNA binding domain protein, excisionase family [Natranaerobius thermophilus JW/NM-WN-LF]
MDTGRYEDKEEITVKEAAEALGVSRDTVMRRIRRGEMKAVKREGSYGDQWFIPASELQIYDMQEVVTVQKSMSPEQVQNIMQKAIRENIENMKEELREEVREDMKEEMESLKQTIEDRDQKLVENLRNRLDQPNNKSLIEKIKDMFK